MTARFVEEKVLPEDGQVNHALREAIKTLLKDYLVCIIIYYIYIKINILILILIYLF